MILTAYEIWKIIHNTHPQKLMEEHNFDSTSEFVLVEDSTLIIESLHRRIAELEAERDLLTA